MCRYFKCTYSFVILVPVKTIKRKHQRRITCIMSLGEYLKIEGGIHMGFINIINRS